MPPRMDALLLLPGPLPARHLLNSTLHRRLPSGAHLRARIVETEYYHESDPSSHCYPGTVTAKNSVMFGPPGRAYVYRSYGIHWCLNCTAAPAGEGCGVLIRAVEPLEGAAEMRALRTRGQKTAVREEKLASGPGNVGQAFGVDLSFGGVDLLAKEGEGRGELWIERGEELPEDRVGVSPRIGITRAVDQPWRFFIKDNPAVSGPKVVKAAKEVKPKRVKRVSAGTARVKRKAEAMSEESTVVAEEPAVMPVGEKRPRRSLRISSQYFKATLS